MGYVLSVTRKSNRETAAPAVDRNTWTQWNMTPTFQADNARSDDDARDVHEFQARPPASEKRVRSESSYSALAILAAIVIALWTVFTLWHLLLPKRRARLEPARAPAKVVHAEKDVLVTPASETPSAL